MKFKKILVILLFVISFQSKALYAFDLSNGMMVNFNFDYGMDIVKSDTFKIAVIPEIPDPKDPNIKSPKFDKFDFDQKFNYMYGADVAFGYMMENGVSAGFSFGYHQSEIVDSKDADSFIKPSIMSGMINIDYAFDLGLILYPYLTFGAGLGRVDMKGAINGADVVLDFKSLKKNKLVYQAGAGLLVKNFGFGYKFFGMMDLSDTDTFNELKLNLTNKVDSKEYEIDGDKLKFGTFENKNHILSAFMRFVI